MTNLTELRKIAKDAIEKADLVLNSWKTVPMIDDNLKDSKDFFNPILKTVNHSIPLAESVPTLAKAVIDLCDRVDELVRECEILQKAAADNGGGLKRFDDCLASISKGDTND